MRSNKTRSERDLGVVVKNKLKLDYQVDQAKLKAASMISLLSIQSTPIFLSTS